MLAAVHDIEMIMTCNFLLKNKQVFPNQRYYSYKYLFFKMIYSNPLFFNISCDFLPVVRYHSVKESLSAAGIDFLIIVSFAALKAECVNWPSIDISTVKDYLTRSRTLLALFHCRIQLCQFFSPSPVMGSSQCAWSLVEIVPIVLCVKFDWNCPSNLIFWHLLPGKKCGPSIFFRSTWTISTK